jgi:polyisoprenoid-binding protein YceI
MDGADSGQLTGDLTMKGVTRPVTLDVTLNGAGKHPMTGSDTFGISASGTLDRTEWNLGYAAPAVGEEVTLRIEAEFKRAEA